LKQTISIDVRRLRLYNAGMSKLAIVDLGSNTCRLVIYTLAPDGAFRLTDQVSETVRIGENMIGSGMLQPEPMHRALQLLKMYAGLCAANGIEHTIATATSAVRDARNGAEFVERVRKETGLALQILSGDAEAFYAYAGAINGFALRDALIADLGGGSLELMQVQNRQPVSGTSLPLGAVRLSEQFLRGDSISKSAAKALTAHIDAQLQSFARGQPAPVTNLIALGGTARALAKVDQRRRGYPIERLHAYELSAEAVEEIADELLKKDLAARLKIKGLKDERADIIPAGALVIRQLMRYTGARSLLVSGRGLREGLLYEYLLKRVYAAREDISPVIQDVRAFGIANLSLLYQIEWAHAQQVCQLALELFDGLRELHGLANQERALLAYAAILHDSGVLIDYYRHHHHSAYLIENADLPGFTHREIALLALLVRWHRRGEPSLEPYEMLCRKSDAALLDKLVACLRLAEDLERSRAQVVRHAQPQWTAQEIRVVVETRQAAEAELWAANRETALWQRAFGRTLRVVAAPSSRGESVDAEAQENIAARAARISALTTR
jgi:exopolyphosphatase/guanosine-5'-triphosphate,3'-diphosphate pyrophosphatase